MTHDNQCGESVLVEAPDGLHVRMCIDPPHPVNVPHRFRFNGTTTSCTHGLARVRVATVDDPQPALV